MGMSRSENMRRIRGRGTRPEGALRAALDAAGLSPDEDASAPMGRPDFVFAEARIAIFVDGCQWHGCPDHYARPGTREDFWAKKLADSVGRDRSQTLALEAAGWRVVRVWEHEVVLKLDEAVGRIRCLVCDNAASMLGGDWRVSRVERVDVEARVERRLLVDLRDANITSETVGRRVTAKARRKRETG